ncbi:MAG TPA: HAMP domain-containing sensor histidine kinase [Paludibacteraceae bacterium]|nr:HAMP domain-containing sensor histidine kinase [Paludibacteraceae bacterium]
MTRKSYYLKIALWVVAFIIVATSLLFSNKLAGRLEKEQHRKMEIWAEAMRQVVNSTETIENFDFLWKIIEENDNIPVLIADETDQIVTARNFTKAPKENPDDYYAKELKELKKKRTPIEIRLDDNQKQYIYYDDSYLLKQLAYFPYVQLSIIAIFLLGVLMALVTIKNSEQNRVWVGLSKETAHQLGTPISSLLAWVEILKTSYPENTLIDDMGNDVNRLRTIAERFSKIGSKAEFEQVNINDTLRQAVNYMEKRTSQMVTYSLTAKQPNIQTQLCVPLFEWVIENLCKNAIDAMDGKGSIHIDTNINDRHQIIIDITDSGKGLEKRQFKTIFKPGYTTKRRGWGLGLSLAKRIIEEHHRGKIFVKQSGANKGTTFRIILSQKKMITKD